MIILVLLYLLFLWKFSDIRKGWLIFAALISILVETGFNMNILRLALCLGLWKVCIDIYDAGS